MSGKGKLVGWTVVLAMWTGMGVGLDYMANDNNKAINTAEDIIYWMAEDVANGYVDSVKADSYIDNLEQMIKELE
tara:strand:+ start:126 stop:350 length:225 start_codon:yes stop_codon:yes gene_type:complete